MYVQVSLVGRVVFSNMTETYLELQLFDGTGTISARMWLDDDQTVVCFSSVCPDSLMLNDKHAGVREGSASAGGAQEPPLACGCPRQQQRSAAAALAVHPSLSLSHRHATVRGENKCRTMRRWASTCASTAASRGQASTTRLRWGR